jgi:hypothetical protein
MSVVTGKNILIFTLFSYVSWYTYLFYFITQLLNFMYVSENVQRGAKLNKFDSNGRLTTSLYDKRDDFDFAIVNFPFLCSNKPL